MVPASWGMPFFTALAHGGARVAGIEDHHHAMFEMIRPCQPYDFPDTPAGKEHIQLQHDTLHAKHARTPAAKRPNFAKLQVEYAFKVDWLGMLRHWGPCVRSRTLYHHNLYIIIHDTVKRWYCDFECSFFRNRRL